MSNAEPREETNHNEQKDINEAPSDVYINPYVYLENFLEMMAAERSAAINTIVSYRNDLTDLVNFLILSKREITSLALDGLDEYMKRLYNQNLSHSSIARKISALRQFCSFLLTEHIIDKNKALEIAIPHIDQRLPKALSQDATEQLLQYVHQQNDPATIRSRAMLELLYATGMRVSELVTLRIDSIEYETKTRKIIGKLTIKGKGARERVVLLNQAAIAALEEYLLVRDSFIKVPKGDKKTSTNRLLSNKNQTSAAKKKYHGYFPQLPRAAKLPMLLARGSHKS